jgi:hypothetical protein
MSGKLFPAYNFLWSFVMKRINTLVLILGASFVSEAWNQQPCGKCINHWSEFHRTNMQRWNPARRSLTSAMSGR